MVRANRRQRVRVKELVARWTLGTGVGYLAASWTISRWLTRRSPCRLKETPSDFGLAWEPLECQTRDGVPLSGWVVEPEHARGTVALFHGLRSSRLRMLPRLAFLVEAGYRCVSFDHRAHGRSGGRRTSFGYFEARDVAAIHTLIRRRWPERPVAALGLSMGAAALCYAARDVRDWQAVILEGLYRDVDTAFARRIGSDYPAWFGRLYPGIVRVTERRLRLDLRRLAPIESVGELAPAPVLFLTGTLDRFAPPIDAEQLRMRYPGPAEVWLVEGAGHSDVFEVGGAEYQRRIRTFLQRNM